MQICVPLAETNEYRTSEWLNGLIDLHLYNAPCVFERSFDMIELAKMCRQAGYRAIVLKVFGKLFDLVVRPTVRSGSKLRPMTSPL